MWNASAPIVVGIDGSDAAINAAVWAIDEAISRDVPLRIVHVTHIEDAPTSEDGDFRLDVQCAEASLRAATAAVNATGKLVKIETEILWGSVESALIDESRNAAMICVGSTGIGLIARGVLGSTAATLAEKAYCPAAIVRAARDTHRSHAGWVVVVVDECADNESVIEYAMEEARLRKAAVLAVGVWREDLGEAPYDELDRRIDWWKQRYPDVHVHPVAARAGVDQFLADNEGESIQLAVVGAANAGRVAQIVGPHGHSLVPHGECSVLVVH